MDVQLRLHFGHLEEVEVLTQRRVRCDDLSCIVGVASCTDDRSLLMIVLPGGRHRLYATQERENLLRSVLYTRIHFSITLMLGSHSQNSLRDVQQPRWHTHERVAF